VSLPLPLSVRLSTARTDRHVTLDAADLTFRSVVPGGFASCVVPLHRPLSLQPDEVAYYGRLRVYDRRSGATVWEGRLEDPARTAGADGQVWELAAVGPSAHTQDRAAPLVYVDGRLDAYERSDNVTPGGTDTVGDDPGLSGTQALILQFPNQQPVVATPQSSRVTALYRPVWRTGQKLARFAFSWDAGRTDGGFSIEAYTRQDDGGTPTSSFTATLATAGGSTSKVVVTNFANGHNQFAVRIRNTSGAPGTVADDTYWISLYNLVLRALLLNADGSEKTTGYSASTVLASEVVADLLGRLLPRYDGANAVVTASSYAIDQLAYPDGVTPGQVLDDLLGFEPDYYWAAWESGPTGLHRFEFVPWPTTVRYEASVEDGFSSPGSADGLYNEARVRWKDAAGAVQTTVRTATVPELDAAGLTRTLPVDLGEEAGSLANAQRRGDQELLQHRYAPNAGTLTVARPTLDLVAGRMAAPWEIRPGNLIRVRGVLPRVDALNATARDGVTVFRVKSTDFRASDATASLELDSHPLSLARQIAAAKPTVIRRR